MMMMMTDKGVTMEWIGLMLSSIFRSDKQYIDLKDVTNIGNDGGS